jgi:hypothetical protein
MYDRCRPWIYASDYKVWQRYKAVALGPWIVALVIGGAGGALLVLVRRAGLWPWGV